MGWFSKARDCLKNLGRKLAIWRKDFWRTVFYPRRTLTVPIYDYKYMLNRKYKKGTTRFSRNDLQKQAVEKTITDRSKDIPMRKSFWYQCTELNKIYQQMFLKKKVSGTSSLVLKRIKKMPRTLDQMLSERYPNIISFTSDYDSELEIEYVIKQQIPQYDFHTKQFIIDKNTFEYKGNKLIELVQIQAETSDEQLRLRGILLARLKSELKEYTDSKNDPETEEDDTINGQLKIYKNRTKQIINLCFTDQKDRDSWLSYLDKAIPLDDNNTFKGETFYFILLHCVNDCLDKNISKLIVLLKDILNVNLPIVLPELIYSYEDYLDTNIKKLVRQRYAEFITTRNIKLNITEANNNFITLQTKSIIRQGDVCIIRLYTECDVYGVNDDEEDKDVSYKTMEYLSTLNIPGLEIVDIDTISLGEMEFELPGILYDLYQYTGEVLSSQSETKFVGFVEYTTEEGKRQIEFYDMNKDPVVYDADSPDIKMEFFYEYGLKGKWHKRYSGKELKFYKLNNYKCGYEWNPKQKRSRKRKKKKEIDK